MKRMNQIMTKRHTVSTQTFLTSFARGTFLIFSLLMSIANIYAQTDLTKDMYNNQSACAYVLDESHDNGFTFYGDGNVSPDNFANLSTYGKLMATFEGATPRFLLNSDGEIIEISGAGDYAIVQGNLIIIDLAKITRDKGSAKLNAVKANWGQTTTLKTLKLEPFREADESKCESHVLYVKYTNDWEKIFSVDFAQFKDKILELYGKSSIYEFRDLYLRWYIADNTTNSYIRGSDGLPISQKSMLTCNHAASPSDCTKSHFWENVGMLWFHDDNDGNNAFSSETDFLNAMNVNVDMNSTTGFFQSNVHMVCLMTDDLTGISRQLEPTNLQHKFIIRFIKEEDAANLDFPLSSNSPTKTYAKRVEGMDDATNIYSLQSVFEELYARATASGEVLNGKTPQYARFYLTSSSGVVMDASSVFSVGDGNTQTYQRKGAKGWVWTGTGFNVSNVTNLKLTKSSGTSWADLRIVCDLTDDMRSSYKVGDVLIEEPTQLAARLIIGFKGSGPEPVGFEGALSDDAFTHTKEVFMTATDVSNGYVDIPLNESFDQILSEYNTNAQTLGNSLHLRWYLTYHGNVVANSESQLAPVVSTGHKTKDGKGIYWNSATTGQPNPWSSGSVTSNSTDVKNVLNVRFTKSDGSKQWTDYKVVVVMSNDISELNGQKVDAGGNLLEEPRQLNMKYTFSIYNEDEFVFVHHKGASERDYITNADDATISTTTPTNQLSWNMSTSDVEDAATDIRQGVHTVEYDVYVKPGETRQLQLPFEGYWGTGNNLEPMAYIRWYDWATDMKSTQLTKVGDWLEDKSDALGSRGYFMLNNSWTGQHPIHSKVGVTYSSSSLTDAGDIIACDVSKYYDGIYKGVSTDSRSDFAAQGYTKPMLVHEPTLSTRYLFHVYPASVIVNKIQIPSNRLQVILGELDAGTKTYSEVKNDMFHLCEDNGRVIVSLNGSTGDFALRAQLQSVDNYYVDDGNACNSIEWYAYLEDEKGLWQSSSLTALTPKEVKGRVYKFDLSSLNGNYTLKSDNPETKYVTAAPGMRFHIIGVLSNGTTRGDAIHYELQFINAPAYLAEDLTDRDVKRTDEYLGLHLDHAGVVNFDNYFPDTNAPTTEEENIRTMPLDWKEAEYGFCYPSIDKYRIATGWSGMTPIHGDYILLKSMKRAGVSSGTSYDNMIRDIPDAGFSHVYLWYNWAGVEVNDYTHTVTDDSKYGAFFYVDASDESRTIATLDFNAHLCSGSQIYFTAAIADVTTEGLTSPQLMAHVYAIDPSTKEKIQVISFLTCVLNTVNKDDGGYKYNKWYQVYGYGTIPENISIGNYEDFTVEIDNYSKDTQGADFCVDQITFYTSTAQVKITQQDTDCSHDQVKSSIYMDGESLKMALGASDDAKDLYWSICDEAGTPLEGIYSSSVSGTNKYGKKTLVPNYKFNDDGTLTTASISDGFFKGEDGNVYFQLIDDFLPLQEGTRYYVSVYSLGNIPSAPPTGYGWGDPSQPCTVSSAYFIAQKMQLSLTDFGGNVTGTISGGCNGVASVSTTVALRRPDSTQPSGFVSYDDIVFDYYRGTKAELISEASIASIGLFVDAIQSFRTWDKSTHGSYTDYVVHADQLASDLTTYKSSEPANGTILEAVKDKLILSATSSFADQISGENERVVNYLAVSVNELTSDNKYVCNPLAFSFSYKGVVGMPTLMLGFDDVNYTEAGKERVIRVGLEQLNKMRKQGYILHVPVNMYMDKNQQSFKKLYFPQDSYLTISAVDRTAQTLVPNTTDPTLPAVGTRFAKIVPTIAGETRPAIDKNHMYLALDLKGDNCKIDFHEGYEYEVATTFHDEEDEGNANGCIGDLFLMIKVVPEFVTWHSQYVDNDGRTTATITGYRSANWYNDDNWKRSTRTEMYKDAKGNSAQQNTPTEGHPEGYDDNGEGSLSELTSGSNPGFVPMKFTYVIMPSGEPAPSLINEPRVKGVGVGERRQGGGFLDLTQTKLLTDRSPRDPDGTPDNQRTSSKPTDNIYYDLLVRYSYKANDPYGEGCFGHRKLRDVLLNSEDALTDEQATIYNTAMKQNKVAGNILTPEEAQAYNSAVSANELNSTDPLTAEQAASYNAIMSPHKVAGDILTAEEAHAYNWDDQGDPDMSALVFDCEKYQGNVCHDIYFKPGAELLRQQRLTYKRAWVEMELDANKWYLLASPLQCTYAGDMYVPVSMTDVTNGSTVKGRQVTEAFQPINFTDKIGSDNLYSRTKYPIYQRSWGQNNGKVYVKKNDIRTTNYSANLNFSTVTTNLAEWGHAFNDVQVPYHTSDNTLSQNLAGFSIRAHKKNQTDKVLIRLPKADTSYEYFDWTNTSSDPAAETPSNSVKSVSKPDYNFKFAPEDPNEPSLFTVPTSYRLVTDEHHHDGDMEYSIDAMQQNGDYVLVGNPYMVSIDMKKFFDANTGLGNDQTGGYWTYEASGAASHLKPTQVCTDIIKPMQGFFVKKGTATKIVFNKDMQVDGNFLPPAPYNNGARQMTLTLSTANGSGSSSAKVGICEQASADYVSGEDVETLFDSNLSNVPMVYTVAGGRAVSIDSRPSMDVVSFGVNCAASDELVEVSFSGTDVVEGKLYVIDAVTGSMTEVGEKSSVMVQPNDYGRYFLTTNGDVTAIKDSEMSDIVVSVRGKQVTVKSNRPLQSVRILTTGGAVVSEKANCGTETSFTLNGGVYIVEAQTDVKKNTVKLMVK